MSRALTGDAPIENHYNRARREIGGVLDSPSILGWLEMSDDEVVRHFLEPKDGHGGWELAPLDEIDLDLVPDRGIKLSGDKVPLVTAMIQLARHPGNATAVTILPAEGWPDDDGLERTASFNIATNVIAIWAPEEEIERLITLARTRMALINREIEGKGPDFRESVSALVRVRRQVLEEEAARLGKLRDRVGGKREVSAMPIRLRDSDESQSQHDLELPDPDAAAVKCLALIEALTKQLRAVNERLNGVDMPPGPKDRLQVWQERLEQGRVSVADWGSLKHDIGEVYQHIEESRAVREYRSSDGRQASFLSGIFEQEKKIENTLEAIDDLPAGSLNTALESNQKTLPPEVGQEAPNIEPREPVVAICHGHSNLYLELRDFLEKRHGVDTTYFENESRTSKSMKEFLIQFGTEATHAVIVLTADDLQASGTTRARQNVVHEIGYFQGRLGFDKVAILVQDGVEEVSNIDGIVPITFEGHRIRNTFLEVEAWLEREGCPRKPPS